MLGTGFALRSRGAKITGDNVEGPLLLAAAGRPWLGLPAPPPCRAPPPLLPAPAAQGGAAGRALQPVAHRGGAARGAGARLAAGLAGCCMLLHVHRAHPGLSAPRRHRLHRVSCLVRPAHTASCPAARCFPTCPRCPCRLQLDTQHSGTIDWSEWVAAMADWRPVSEHPPIKGLLLADPAAAALWWNQRQAPPVLRLAHLGKRLGWHCSRTARPHTPPRRTLPAPTAPHCRSPAPAAVPAAVPEHGGVGCAGAARICVHGPQR